MRTVPSKFLALAEAFFHMRRHKFRDNESRIEMYGPWKKLGNGYYGEAWAHDEYPDLVIKISGPAGWGYTSDYDFDPSTHDAWPTFARHCAANPHPNLPEVLHFVQYSERMAWAIMPRYIGMQAFTERAREIRSSMYAEDTDEEWLWPLRQMVSSLGFCIDLHQGNFMLTDTGETVMTDPFSDPSC